MLSVSTAYISNGGNRHPAAADWDQCSGILAFGADQNVAIAKPLDPIHRGVQTTLSAHKDKVNAVKFLTKDDAEERTLLAGGVDCSLSVWRLSSITLRGSLSKFLKAHDGSINAIAVSAAASVFATAAADGTVKVWSINKGDDAVVQLLCVVELTPKYIPLAIVLGEFEEQHSHESLFLVIGGTKSAIQTYSLLNLKTNASAKLQAILSGHEGWVRSLDLRRVHGHENQDLLLASASQDKYIRLWRLSKASLKQSSMLNFSEHMGPPMESTLTAKTQSVEAPGHKLSITFEALLLGHEDWIYSVAWSPETDHLQLLSASADNSLTVWEPDVDSGIWINTAHLGEISDQKGSTSATGSTGGFWKGLWCGKGGAVCSLAKTGSWRIWQYNTEQLYWVQTVGLSGHVGTVTDLAWEKQGRYLLSTCLDQTTRLHGRWEREDSSSWHELSRPQIHGYDLNCLASIRADQFVSGADEKPLRVFDQPRLIAGVLDILCKISLPSTDAQPGVASIPVLGLSNKAVDDINGDTLLNGGLGEENSQANATSEEHLSSPNKSRLNISRPPLEDDLARTTLWPECEKLYGHGYEISAVAASHDQSVIATACKSSSVDHAVIRLFDCSNWHEIKPCLSLHSLTVTRVRFSFDDQFILSVGRDRQWAVFERAEPKSTEYRLKAHDPKGHSRMILDAAWVLSPISRTFVTAGRDKSVKIWCQDGESFNCKATISRKFPVTAIDVRVDASGEFCLAVGEEDGQLSLHTGSLQPLKVHQPVNIGREKCPSKTVTRLEWRPRLRDGKAELAVASQDTSLRILEIDDGRENF